jgi:CBS domain-containing protein
MNPSKLPVAESLFTGLTVRDAMHHGIVTCAPSASLREVAELLSEHRIHCAVVTEHPPGEKSPAVWGLVSDLDLMRGLGSPLPLTAGNLAALEVVTVGPADDLGHAAQQMAEHDVAHLIVATDGAPVGILSTLDIARAVASDS